MFNLSFPEITPQRLAVKLSVVGERTVRSGHPWIFSESIIKINKKGNAGDIAIIYSHSKNKAIGVGLYDPQSPIRIKMVHFEGAAALNEDFFSQKIDKAFAIRHELLETNTNSYRFLFGENDGFPGFIADVYADVLVVKLYSAIWFPYFEIILRRLIEVSGCTAAVLRLSRRLQASEVTPWTDGIILYGTLKNEVIEFVEHGINFSANVIRGHKTGYFLDHRENRRRVGKLSENKTVLDVFSYSGGFSVHALANGAKEVTSLDISEKALENAMENGKLNSYKGIHKTVSGDAFKILAKFVQQKKQFDVVVIDPPSFAKSAKEVEQAKKKYEQLADLGIRLTASKGLLVLASCSSRVSAEDFFGINEKTFRKQSREYKVQLKTTHDSDHPISFSEGAYLKCGYYRFKE